MRDLPFKVHTRLTAWAFGILPVLPSVSCSSSLPQRQNASDSQLSKINQIVCKDGTAVPCLIIYGQSREDDPERRIEKPISKLVCEWRNGLSFVFCRIATYRLEVVKPSIGILTLPLS